MIAHMRERGPALEADDVADLEQRLGISFPNEYRAFLLTTNGGRPQPNAFPIVGLADNPFGVIQVFFAVNDAVECCSLDWNYHMHRERIPDNLFPIACDDGGDLICLSLQGDDIGHVVFWDYYNAPPEPSYANVHHIANTFDTFIESICELP